VSSIKDTSRAARGVPAKTLEDRAIHAGMFVAMYVVASLHRPPQSAGTSGGRVNQQAANREFIMNITRATTTGAMLLALTISATPAVADSRDQDGRDRRQERTARVQPNNGGSNSRPQSNGAVTSERQTRGTGDTQARREVAVPRSAPRVDYAPRTNDRQSANRQTDTRQNTSRQPDMRGNASRGSDNRAYDNRGYTSRGSDNRAYDNRGYTSRGFDNRAYDNRRYDNRVYSYGGYGSYRGYGYRPYISRPYVRFGLGISIFAGSPYGFRFDYGWAPPYAYRFPMRAGIGYGGMSFLIDPDDAAVYVDGEFIGIARDFDGQPVPLSVGVHEIQLQAEGCEPVVFDVSVRPGQVIPYRGSLMSIR
jgi:hypothetical protein